MQAGKHGKQLLVTTVNALTQRVLTPFRVRESVRELKPGVEIGHESLAALLQRQGYSRTDTVIDSGEFAVRGSIFDIHPSGLDAGLRLDFFGDEIESLRLFDPDTQRTTEVIDSHLLLPASEALLDEASIKRFRSRYREMFGANATQDPLYQAVSEGRRLAGMEHWLPLFEDKLATLFDHLGKDDLMVIDSAALGAAEERFGDIADYHRQRGETTGQAAGNYRPLAEPMRFTSRTTEFERVLAGWPVHRSDIFAQPDSAQYGGFRLPFGARFHARALARGKRLPGRRASILRQSARPGANRCSPPIPRARAAASSRSSRKPGRR